MNFSDFSTREYLIVNTLIVLILVLYFLWRRPKAYRGFRLKNTRTYSKDSSLTKESFSLKILDQDNLGNKEQNSDSNIKSDPHSINTIFIYNGHEWDAYEVLGIPAGSSEEKAKEALRKMMSQADKESRIFFKTAYKAILEGRKRSNPSKN